MTAKQFPYIGVIGSKAKSARLKKDIVEAGLPDACKEMFYCPMGLPIGNNHPHEIAISIAAQLLEQRDKFLQVEKSGNQLVEVEAPLPASLPKQESVSNILIDGERMQ